MIPVNSNTSYRLRIVNSYYLTREKNEKTVVNFVIMSLISLPCYEGFDAFAIWPEDESVSNLLIEVSEYKYQYKL